eukprot:CAMPEP_0206032960 /NCGR_PEP_ID=MMETSP1466-20131121/326_1 /ASSEMBLY_ACC=CAM_ASM_001126 /TAXON_ID=44452 /ORGANISM="Pavlova gyrans, Strain CCMP608" /LENGTH=55 /DNA_ID=CAMNT_0053407123 /DNA_START=282 /DNA_END=446 /DNA_ORIENTATION=+
MTDTESLSGGPGVTQAARRDPPAVTVGRHGMRRLVVRLARGPAGLHSTFAIVPGE